MRQTLVFAVLATAVAISVVNAWQNAASPENEGPAEIVKTTPHPMPINQVVFFSSGVGYFQREGEVNGNAEIDLSFPPTDINDLLKSLVLQDLGGGKVSTIGYDSHDPVEHTLRSFAIDLATNPSYGEILNQARGQKVEVSMNQTAATQPATLTGIIIGMESQRVPAGRDTLAEVEQLNLLSAEGMRGIPLAHINRVRFLNPVLDSEFKQALEIIARSHDNQKKSVTLGFTGLGKRKVRVGYVIENPIWKTSYRLVVDKQTGKCFLHGWATVENTTDEDWKNVKMTLVAGRPISFQMDLYQPLYVPRPTVEPELFASLRPPAFLATMDPAAEQFPGRSGVPDSALQLGGVQFGGYIKDTDRLNRGWGNNIGFHFGGSHLGGFPAGGYSFGSTPFDPFAGNRYARTNFAQMAAPRLNHEELLARRRAQQEVIDEAKRVGAGLVAVDPGDASGGDIFGDYFKYEIDQPVTLPRQKSAMLPIINKDVEGEKISIYNPGVHRRFPLLGLRFKNTTGNHLMQGPITVYDGSTYAGDARIMDVQPDEERLLAYAVDLGSEVKVTSEFKPGKEWAVRLTDDEPSSRFRMRQTTTYTIRNRSPEDRLVCLLHPLREDWKLVFPEKPRELTRETYRFEVHVPAGKTVNYAVEEERMEKGTMSFTAIGGVKEPWTKGTAVDVRRFVIHDDAYIDFVPSRLSEPAAETTVTRNGSGLRCQFNLRETRTYHLVNNSQEDLHFTIDHAVRLPWKLISPAPAKDLGARVYRYEMVVKKGESKSLDVVEEVHRFEDAKSAASEDTTPAFLLPHDTEVRLLSRPHPDELVAARILKGKLLAQFTERVTRSYLVQNRGDKLRTITIEHLVAYPWKRVGDDKPIEGSRNLYRHDLQLAAGQSVTWDVVEERQVNRDAPLLSLSVERLQGYLESKTLSPAVKTALETILALQRKLDENRKALAEAQKKLKEIEEEQVRLRANLDKVPPASAAYKRYLEKFDTQETQIEALQDAIRKCQEKEKQLNSDLEACVTGLNAE